MAGLLLRSTSCGPDDRPPATPEGLLTRRMWMGTSMECGGSQHMAISGICLTVLLLLSIICLTLVMTAAQRSPVSRSWLAKVSGRSDVVFVLGKLMLAIFANTITGPSFRSSWISHVPILLLAMAWFAGSLIYQPY